MKYVGDIEVAKNIVHDVFLALWEKFESLPSDTNYRSYLYTAVRNRSLNFIRDQKKVVSLDGASDLSTSEGNNPMETEELETQIELAISQLPERCRIIFEMSRYEELKYSEIAKKMGISIKTVEAQISKALGILRRELSGFLSVLFFIFCC